MSDDLLICTVGYSSTDGDPWGPRKVHLSDLPPELRGLIAAALGYAKNVRAMRGTSQFNWEPGLNKAAIDFAEKWKP